MRYKFLANLSSPNKFLKQNIIIKGKATCHDKV